MSAKPTPSNRRQRRAAARTKDSTATIDSHDVPLVRPDYNSRPTGKTLLQLADERRALLSAGTPFPPNNKQTTAHHANDDDDDGNDEVVVDKDGDFEFMSTEPLPALATALLYTVSLSAVHTTLDVLVLSQYAQDISFRPIVGRLVRLTPGLFLALWILHSERVNVRRYAVARQVFFFVVAGAAAGYLFYAGNEEGYYYVMRKAPPLGTLWVWSVVELELVWTMVHVVGVAAWVWWKGYGVF
jgi:hypothetical protein